MVVHPGRRLTVETQKRLAADVLRLQFFVVLHASCSDRSGLLLCTLSHFYLTFEQRQPEIYFFDLELIRS